MVALVSDQSNVISAKRGETVVENDVDLVQDDTVAYGPELSDANLGKGNLEQDERGSNLEVVQDDNPTIDDKVLRNDEKIQTPSVVNERPKRIRKPNSKYSSDIYVLSSMVVVDFMEVDEEAPMML